MQYIQSFYESPVIHFIPHAPLEAEALADHIELFFGDKVVQATQRQNFQELLLRDRAAIRPVKVLEQKRKRLQ